MKRRSFVLSIAVFLFAAGAGVRADEVKVLTSGGFSAALAELAPQFERMTGTKITVGEAPTMGGGNSIPERLRRGDRVDVVILSAAVIDDMVKDGRITAGSRVDLGRSGIGMAVRKGAAKPDITSVDALRRALLQASSIAYSSSISGVYLTTELFPRLGIADQIRGKSRRIEGERVGAVVARGEAEIGFQQTSELVPLPGIDYVGPLPAEVQRVTTFSAAIAASAAAPDAARRFIAFLASAAAVPAIVKAGLEAPPRP